MKKYIALILALCLTIAVLAYLKKDTNEETTTTGETLEVTTEETTEAQADSRRITIGYYEGKSLNPFKTDSPTNRSLATLIYDGLYILDESYKPEPVIAESSQRDPGRLTVYIKDGLTFSSGAELTASDVVYSFEAAKKSEYYSPRLHNFTAATAGTNCVVFTLSSELAYAESCLTFPIIQAGTAENDIPIGSGRYSVQQSQKERYLAANEKSTREEYMNTDKLYLTPISSKSTELYLLQSGDLTYYFDDLSDGKYIKIGANMQTVPLNNLVFLGINSSSEKMKDKAIAKAISLAIDKSAIAESAYSGMCRAAYTPFNPNWYALSSLSAESDSYSSIKAAQVLEDADYIFAYPENVYRSKNFEFLELTMLVNKENTSRTACAELICSSLRSIGINVTLSILPFDEYIDALSNGEFDIYLGEVKLSADMDLSCFFTDGNPASYGIDSTSTTAKAYSDFAKGLVDITTFVKVFNDAKPFIPICFRDGIAYYSREISFEGSITEQELFLNAYSWELINNQ